MATQVSSNDRAGDFAGTSLDKDEFWPQVVRFAQDSASDRARLKNVTFVSFDGSRISFQSHVHPDTNPQLSDRLRDLISRATGRNDILISTSYTPGERDEYQELASTLSGRLVAIEQFLRSRKGQVRTTVDFESHERTHELSWQRDAGEWTLCVSDIPLTDQEAEENGDPEYGPAPRFNRRPLSQCSVDVKVNAASAIPKLLEAMKRAETEQIVKLKQAHQVLDTATEQLGLMEGM
jgi:hypothetical protein